MIERNRMRHKKIILLLILLFLLLAGAATTGLFLQRRNRQNAAAKVGGSLITQEQVEAVLENQAFRLDWLRAEQAACSDPLMADRLNEEIQKRESYTREEALDTLIRKELIRQECAALGITVSEEEALRVLKVIPGYTVQFKICLAESYESKDMSLPEFFNEFMKQSAEKMEGQNEQ